MSLVVIFVLFCIAGTILRAQYEEQTDLLTPCLNEVTGADLCPSDEACANTRTKFGFPDPAQNFAGTAWNGVRLASCMSTDFCSWIGANSRPCVTVFNPALSVNFPVADFDCAPITIDIQINQTISCCHDGIDCAQIADNIYGEPLSESPYTGDACHVTDAAKTQLISDVSGCYATVEFLSEVICNYGGIHGKCPDLVFDTYQTYARCACNVIAAYDDAEGEGSEAYKHFHYLTYMVEQAFKSMRSAKEDCPPWQFSCNAEGDAILEAYEIRCPLEVDAMSNLDTIGEAIYNLVGAKWSKQVAIDASEVVVFMYSEEDMLSAVDVLALNTSANVPMEVVTERCTLNNEKLQNLDEDYGDYTTTTKAGDSAPEIMFMPAILFVLSWFVVML